MAVISDIEIRLRADIARLQQDMTRARQSVTSAVDTMRKSLLGLAAGFSLVEIGRQVIQAQREFDKLNSSLVTATGSTKAAGEAMKALQDFAARTPFSLQEVTDGFLKLRNLGLTPSERALESYGNTSAAMGKSLMQLVEAVADATTGEFERLKEFGIKAKQQGDQVSLTFQGTTTKIGNNAAEIEEYLTKIGEVNFAGGMSRQADTLDGDLARLGDTWSQTLVAFSQSGFGDVVRGSVGALSNSLEDLKSIFAAVTSEADEQGKKVDELNGVHFLLTTTFETLAVLGLNVAFAFKAVGRNIGALAAAVANPTQAIEILRTRFSDLGKEWDQVNADSDRVLKAAGIARAKAAAEQGKQTEDRLAGYKIQGDGAKGLSDTEIKAAAKVKQAYDELMSSLQARVDATAREVAGLVELTKSEQAHADLTEKIRLGKIKLTKEQERSARSLIDEAGANEVLARSSKDYQDLQKQLADNAKDLAQERNELIESARQEAEQNEFLVQTFGMAEAAVARLQAARLLEQEAQRLGRELTAEEIEDLQKVIALKERSAQAVANRAELEQAKQFWTDIDKTARDTFVSIADGGKNAFQRLKDTAKNVFFDWLYQQTLKKWIINVGVASGGVAGAVGSGIAGGISSASGLAGLIGSASGIGAGALQTAGALIGGQIGLGTTINAGIAALTSGTAAGVSAGLASLAGTLGPISLGIGGAVTLLNKAFGRGPKTYSDTSTIEGTFGANGLDAARFAEWSKKGGWFSSTKRGRDRFDLSAETTAALTTAYDAIKASSAQYAEALGLNADSIMNRTQAIKIALGKDEAANQQAIADFFSGVADTVATEVLPNIAQFQQAGETAAATLQRVAVNFTALDQILAALGTDSQTAFRAVGVASIEARERLVALAGGIEALASQTDYFVANFLSEAEQIAIIQGPLNKALADLGYAGITTADQFKAAVQGLIQSGAAATEEGAKRLAGLLALGPQFKTVADYLKELADAADQAAKDAKELADALAAQALADNEALLRAAVDSAFDAVGRAVDAQRKQITAAYEADSQRIAAAMERVSGRVSDLTRLSDALRGAMRGVESDAQQVASRGAARAQVQAAIAIAKASGALPSADDLAGALSTLRLDAGDQFSSLADYQREVARTNSELATLGGMTEKQLTDAQRQLAVLESQKELLERNYQAEMERLDGILEWAQAEVDAINGVDRSVQSVVAAIAGLKVAGAALQQGAKPSNPTGSNLTVEQLYRTVLGREGEKAGIEFWKNAFGEVVDAEEYKQFIKGAQPELDMLDRQQRQASAAAPMSGTMSSSSASNQQDMAQMNARLDRIAVASEQFAAQLNQLSGGGNALLVEVG